MLEFFKDATDKIKAFAALLTDMSKAFDCLCHDLTITKLHAYGLVISSLSLLQDYLSNRKQRTKVKIIFKFLGEIFYLEYHKALSWVLFCLVFLCVTYSLYWRLSTFLAMNIPFAVTDNNQDVIRSLEEVGENLITRFSKRQMKLNPDKCRQLLKTK